jgi:hypothetical protein
MIGAKTAFVLYGLLAGVAVLTLHSTARWVSLVVVLGLAAKTLVDLLRRRMEG